MDATEYILDPTKLTFEGDFNQQVQEILSYVRLSKHEVQNLQLLIDDLYQTLSQVWQGCEVNCFGSIVTGLGIKTSDLDCYIKLPSWHSPSEKPFVLKAKEVLGQHYCIFQRLFAIPTAKIPIVKFYHVPTQRSCDISFNSFAGVRNSKLLTYLLNIDQRVRDLTILIKYWSKVHNLTGINLLSNYCLTLLVVFYLQLKKVLPNVMDLQENIEEDYVDDWNTAFHETNNVNFNYESLYQLLGGFFNYYRTFEFDKFIISPFIGRPVERGLFTKLETVPSEFALYKKNLENNKQCKPLRIETYWCVQDPFVHNKNNAVAVHPKLAERILFNFRTAAELYNMSSRENYLKRLFTKIDTNNSKIKNIPRITPFKRGIHKQYKQNGNIFKHIKFKGKNIKNWK